MFCRSSRPTGRPKPAPRLHCRCWNDAMTAREVTLHVAQGAAERGAQESLEYWALKAQLDRRDRAFATNLAFGAIKMRRLLEWILQPYIGKRGKPLPPAISEILRL